MFPILASAAEAGILVLSSDITAEEVAEKLHSPAHGDHRGLKPKLILHALRGAEAPLFHGTVRI